MNEALAPMLYSEDPYADHLAGRHISEQAAFLEELNSFTPAFAYEAGRSALGAAVEVDVASVEQRPAAAESLGRPPEARVAEVAAEHWRQHTPFNPENAALFGSEQERQRAAEAVRDLAGQARLTGKYFNGTHKRLSRQFAAGEITADAHDDAVGEIMAVMALTKPEQLRQVAEAQRAAIERRLKAGVLPEDTTFKAVTSYETADGTQLAGIEAIVARMQGVDSKDALISKGLELKKAHYREDAYIKAGLRMKAQEEQRRLRTAAFMEQQQIERRTWELIDEAEQTES